ncbi:hypothetical protein GGR34_001969 [Microvirga flocculans]|uniref:DUF2783 domain-containing protein n=1 Tax=Microvirga flocculans TaxID=217168 RepID=A0A7W6IFR1_9HYPH|nr:DUF2783 domain-containing protein [Microvirga flocculans]MBB4040316.1 hypothetical protein [Microvirga flocculans]
MTALIVENRFSDPDRAYRALIEAHRGLSDQKSAALNSRVVLILANHIGDLAVLQEALGLGKQSMEQTIPDPSRLKSND